MSEIWRKLNRTVELPAAVLRLLPKSGTRSLAMFLFLALWSRPVFQSAFSADGMMGWQLWPLYPLNLTVPISAAVLLAAALRGYRHIETCALAALWVQAIGISIWVALGAYAGPGWFFLLLFITTISWLREKLVGWAAERSITPTAPVRILGAFVAAALAFALLVPYGFSMMAARREDNRLYVAVANFLWPESPATAPPAHAPRARTAYVPQAARLPVYETPTPAVTVPPSEDFSSGVTPSERCGFPTIELSQRADDAMHAWDAAIGNVSTTMQQYRSIQETYLREYMALTVHRPFTNQLLAWWGEIARLSAPKWDPDPRAPEDIQWTRPLIAPIVAGFSSEARDGKSAAPAGERGATRIFPIDIGCEEFGQPANDGSVWAYAIPTAGVALPPTVNKDGEGRTVVRFPPETIERAGSIVDFARFIGAGVSVSLAQSGESELYDHYLEGAAPVLWEIDVKTDLPALIVQGERLVPGRLLRAHGGDRCKADPGFEIQVKEMPEGPITGFVLLADEALAARVSVVSTASSESTMDDLKRIVQLTRLDVSGDEDPDITFRSARYEVRDKVDPENESPRQESEDNESGEKESGKNERWVSGPWYRSGIMRASFEDKPSAPTYDAITHENCDTR